MPNRDSSLKYSLEQTEYVFSYMITWLVEARALALYDLLMTTLLLCAAYREPFLYTMHYNAVQVMHIADRAASISTPPWVLCINCLHSDGLETVLLRTFGVIYCTAVICSHALAFIVASVSCIPIILYPGFSVQLHNARARSMARKSSWGWWLFLAHWPPGSNKIQSAGAVMSHLTEAYRWMATWMLFVSTDFCFNTSLQWHQSLCNLTRCHYWSGCCRLMTWVLLKLPAQLCTTVPHWVLHTHSRHWRTLSAPFWQLSTRVFRLLRTTNLQLTCILLHAARSSAYIGLPDHLWSQDLSISN